MNYKSEIVVCTITFLRNIQTTESSSAGSLYASKSSLIAVTQMNLMCNAWFCHMRAMFFF